MIGFTYIVVSSIFSEIIFSSAVGVATSFSFLYSGSIPYAVSTHIKTEVANDDGKTRSAADWDRIFKMFVAHGYRGYMGLEYEAGADAETKVPTELRRLAEMSRKYSA